MMEFDETIKKVRRIHNNRTHGAGVMIEDREKIPMTVTQDTAAVAPVDQTPADTTLFVRNTQAIFWNNHLSAIQRMLDYDTLIGRERSSVAAIVSPTSGNRYGKFFFGNSEIYTKAPRMRLSTTRPVFWVEEHLQTSSLTLINLNPSQTHCCPT